MPSHPILITGATGNTGRELIRALKVRGARVRAACSSPERGRSILGEEQETCRLDFRDPATWDPALEGCSALFLLRPPPISKVEETLNPFVDRARAAGVEQVVFLSVAGAEKNTWVPHHGVERHLIAAGGSYTLLRPGFFAQNLQDAYLEDLREDDRLFVPAGKGMVTFVDLHDVAEVAAEALMAPERHGGAAYTLTGPEPLTFFEVARILSEALERPITYRPASVPGYLWHLRGRKKPWAQALVQTVLHLGLRFGQAETVDPTLEQVLGRPGRKLSTYVEENAALWRV